MNFFRNQQGRIVNVEPGQPGERQPGLEELIVDARAIGDNVTADALETEYIRRAVFERASPAEAPPVIRGTDHGETARDYFGRLDEARGVQRATRWEVSPYASTKSDQDLNDVQRNGRR